jgi:hypothetical protein
VLVFEAEAGQVRVRQRKGGRLEVMIEEGVWGRWQSEARLHAAAMLASAKVVASVSRYLVAAGLLGGKDARPGTVVEEGQVSCTVSGVHPAHKVSESSYCFGMDQKLLDALRAAEQEAHPWRETSSRLGDEQPGNEAFYRSLQEEASASASASAHLPDPHEYEAAHSGMSCMHMVREGDAVSACGLGSEHSVHQIKPKGNGGSKRLRDKSKEGC